MLALANLSAWLMFCHRVSEIGEIAGVGEVPIEYTYELRFTVFAAFCCD